MLKSRCVYAYVFETSPEATLTSEPLSQASNPGQQESAGASMTLHKYTKIPHPFIIEPPREGERNLGPGDTITFHLILVGRAIEYLPYFIYTFDELGKTGIGRGRGAYELLTVEAGGFQVYGAGDKTIRPFPANELVLPLTVEPDQAEQRQVTLRLITPVRISYGRSLASDLPFHVLIRNLLRRLYQLGYFHCGQGEPAWDHQRIIEAAQNVTVAEDNLQWWDWERYSTRQHVRMKMGGLVGEITYKGAMRAFEPFLGAGEILHVGKGTSFGLGKYEVRQG
jgi:hypothetical protein